MRYANFTDSIIHNTNFREANIIGVIFIGTKLEYIDINKIVE